MLQLFSQETDLLMKVIMKCVNIKLLDILNNHARSMYFILFHLVCGCIWG